MQRLAAVPQSRIRGNLGVPDGLDGAKLPIHICREVLLNSVDASRPFLRRALRCEHGANLRFGHRLFLQHAS